MLPPSSHGACAWFIGSSITVTVRDRTRGMLTRAEDVQSMRAGSICSCRPATCLAILAAMVPQALDSRPPRDPHVSRSPHGADGKPPRLADQVQKPEPDFRRSASNDFTGDMGEATKGICTSSLTLTHA